MPSILQPLFRGGWVVVLGLAIAPSARAIPPIEPCADGPGEVALCPGASQGDGEFGDVGTAPQAFTLAAPLEDLRLQAEPAAPAAPALALEPEAMVTDPPLGANAPSLDLDPGVIENSPTLQRWLRQIPDVAQDIRHQPSFRPRLRVGYAQFPSTAQVGGFAAALEDVLLLPGTGLAASADYSRSWNGQRESYGGEARYYLLPLGGYVNLAPTLGYRSLTTPAYHTEGLEVGVRLLLVPSRGGGADLALGQRWVAPGSDREVGITSLTIGYAVTGRLRLGTDFQLQNSSFGQDSRVGVSLELLL